MTGNIMTGNPMNGNSMKSDPANAGLTSAEQTPPKGAEANMDSKGAQAKGTVSKAAESGVPTPSAGSRPNTLLTVIALVAGVDALAFPGLPAEALQARVEDDVRHAARLALGPAAFLVDRLWDRPPFGDRLRDAVRHEIARARTQTAWEAAAPADGPGLVPSLPHVTFIDPPATARPPAVSGAMKPGPTR